ncbi:ATP-dependent protease specificity component and chaperone [Campylobacter blaseri]|uniref:ATP-dependent Clp protease ATP-binding subunit ClpX n=1 Tax=Campylobacter blaseri TaxID=2042961 RepID=A0A2P8R130_9BACT|nr:ATP-dependent Clp protease ATP-binding subunit ClpX [Campylobacter blaseri]PSM52207.1 ATP-dependent Clp protease ATP-binding subunit ClpX [Campylobacter blaseri]PSM53973.1 ATP-dependent Clp protease ATP-binding subunit ClpX [Campylobacter blaseri]QKF85411.1 ATP-dependent protease specificity component and chaperone [Campylobacter blaseri]
MVKICSFCKEPQKDGVKFLINDKKDAYLCEQCVDMAYEFIHGGENKDVDISNLDNESIKHITPKELKDVLDSYVVGQDRAKKAFSVGVYNHYKRIFKQNDVKDDTEISKSNILFIGPTGSGKTLMAQTLARYLDIPIAICDATSLTEAGYVGEDVENILTKLLQAADGDIKKAEQGIVFVDELDKISRMSENRSITRDVSGEGVQQALLKIIEGSVVNIPPKGGRKHPNQEFIQIDTTNILFVCGGAFDGLNEIINRRIGKNVLGFNQDKRTKKENSNLTHLVESDDLVHYGIIPELLGRLHIIATLDELDKEDMVRILTEPKNAILKQYEKIFAIDGAKLKVDEEALLEVASLAIKRKTGARGLRSIMEEIMLDIMFDLPELKGYDVVITKDVVDGKEKPILIKQDILSE